MKEQKLAVVDVGSNTVKYDLYRFGDRDEKEDKLFSDAKTVGLARMIDRETNRMTEEGISALIEALREFQNAFTLFGDVTVYPVATACLRGIENAGEATMRVREELGWELTVLSGEEEAEISFESVLANVPNLPEVGFTADMGGGSTDLTLFRYGIAERNVSLPVGCVNLRRYCASVLPTEREAEEITRAVLEEVKKADFPSVSGTLVCVGGTSKALGSLLCARKGLKFENGISFPASDLFALGEDYLKKTPTPAQVEQLIRVCPERLHSVLTGLAAHLALLTHTGCGQVIFTTASLRDGLLRQIRKEQR